MGTSRLAVQSWNCLPNQSPVLRCGRVDPISCCYFQSAVTVVTILSFFRSSKIIYVTWHFGHCPLTIGFARGKDSWSHVWVLQKRVCCPRFRLPISDGPQKIIPVFDIKLLSGLPSFGLLNSDMRTDYNKKPMTRLPYCLHVATLSLDNCFLFGVEPNLLLHVHTDVSVFNARSRSAGGTIRPSG